MAAFADDVEAIREALGVDRWVVFGHSWGGVMARAWAKAHPDRVAGVLLASPSAAVGAEWAAMESQVMAYLRQRVSFWEWLGIGCWSLVAMIPGRLGNYGMDQVYRRVLRAYTGLTEVPEWVRFSSARAAHHTRVAMRAKPADVLDGLGLPAGVPARAVFGDRDIYGPIARRFAERQRDIETTFITDCGHVLWHGQPGAWDAWLVEGFRACGLIAPDRE